MSIEPDDAIEGIVHPPDSMYPYYAAMADAVAALAEEADIPYYAKGAEVDE